MYTLYIDTHSEKIIIVLYKDTSVIIKKEVETHQNHSITTMPIINEVLILAKIKVNDIKEIIVVNGPGSFTGIRIGVTIAKTLGFSLQIPVKTMSSLLVKAVSFTHDEVTIVEREKNGVFLGGFDKNNQLIKDYTYLSNKEYEEREEFIEDIELDYEKIILYAKSLESINHHSINPLYVKKIEVQK